MRFIPILLVPSILFSDILSIRSPVKIEPKRNGITSTFGESRFDHFHNGIDISGGTVPVYPALPGEILYYEVTGLYHPAKRFPSGTGNLLWLRHEKDYLSGYYHLHTILFPEKGIAYVKDDILGVMGNTGRSTNYHLHFFLMEGKKRIRNPLHFMEKESDTVPPVIEHIAFLTIREDQEDEEEILIIPPGKKQKVTLTQSRPVYLKVYDSSNIPGTRRLPYHIEWEFISPFTKETHFYRFDYLENRPDGMYLNGVYAFKDVFYKKYIRLKTFPYSEGLHTLRVTAIDYNGNKTTKEFYFDIDKKY